VNNLAGCLYALGDAAGALPLFRRALESSERVLGAEHPQTLGSVNNLASCLRALGDAAGALPLYRRAAEGMERLYGPDHPSTRIMKANLDSATRDSARDSAMVRNEKPKRPWWQELLG
jgi:tetratricopeptide (TPR) repeat protein